MQINFKGLFLDKATKAIIFENIDCQYLAPNYTIEYSSTEPLNYPYPMICRGICEVGLIIFDHVTINEHTGIIMLDGFRTRTRPYRLIRKQVEV
jgi:hypothetical protein